MANSRADYKLGEPIEEGVTKKIKALQNVFGDSTSSENRQAYIQLQQSTPWIRMQSGVKLSDTKAKTYGVGPGYDLAKKNILFGLNKRVEATDETSGDLTLQSYDPNTGVIPGYEQTNDFGIRPRPGITNMHIHSHNRFGSLRTAVVNFQCWSKEQIDALELLYMRPGYTVLLEWGHSKNLKVNTDGSIAGVEDMDLGLDLYEYNTAISLRNAILNKKISNHFGYDAIIGTIKNFNWKLRKDGGYDCSTSLVTAGDIIESYKANFFLSQDTILVELQDELRKAGETNDKNTQGTRFIFPKLHKDDNTPVAQLGPVVQNLMENWAAQANNSIKEIAKYLEAGGIFEEQDYKSSASRAQALQLFLRGQLEANNGNSFSNSPLKMDDFINEIDSSNELNVRTALVNLLKELTVVDLKNPEHRFQGRGFRIKKYYAPRLTKYTSYTPDRVYYSSFERSDEIAAAGPYSHIKYRNLEENFAEPFDIELQSNHSVLVDFYFGEKDPNKPEAPHNGFGKAGTPDIKLPEGGRAGFQIPYKNRFDLLQELLEAAGFSNWSETGFGGKLEHADGFPLFQVYGLLGNLIKTASEKVYGTDKVVWEFELANRGEPSGTGLTLDPNDGIQQDANITWKEAADELYDKFREVHVTTGYREARFSKFSLVRDSEARNLYADIPTNDPLPDEITIGDYITDYESLLTDVYSFDSTSGMKHKQVTEDYQPHVNTEARFMVMKWNGFIPGQDATTSRNAAGTDESGQSYVVHDPNDDYVSKLHFYLRVLIEAKYTSEYLKENLIGQSFSQTFRFRKLPEYDEVVSKIFPDKRKGPLLNSSKTPTKQVKTVPSKVQSQLKSLIGGRFVSEAALDIRNHVYIPLGVLLEILNSHILRSDSESFFSFQTAYKSNSPEYLTFDDHISMDPRVCILPHTIHEIFDAGNIPSDISKRPEILNIQLSINYILDTLNKYIGIQSRAPMYDFVASILDGIAKVCGGQNDFQLQYAEDDAIFHVVDRRSISKTPYDDLKKTAEINIFGLNSIVRDVNLVSQLSAKMSSMIAISAQDSAYTSQDEATGFNGINRGLTDLIYTKRYDLESAETAEESAIDSYEKAQEALRKKIIGVITHLGMFYEKCIVPRHSVDTMIGSYENYCKYLFGADTEYNRTNKRSTYSFIIPFELHLSMYGISNLRVMDSFVINKDLLPKTYGGDPNQPVGFLITGVEHQVDRSNWTTKLKTQIFNVEDTPNTPKFTNLQTDFVDAVKHIQVYNPGNGGGSGATGTGAPGPNGRLEDSELAMTKGGKKLLKEAAAKFDEMYDAADAAGYELKLVGGYRTFESQNKIFDWDLYVETGGSLTDTKATKGAKRAKKGSNGKTAAAFPGTSNHGLGVAIDIGNYDDNSLLGMYWVMKNGYKYGWSWYEGYSIDEQWHFTYTTDSSKLKEYPLDSKNSRIKKFAEKIEELNKQSNP